MTFLSSIFFFLLGSAIGSFLNVVILRYGTEKTLGGRSLCPSCSTALRWYELIPILSFLIQGGRCRSCNKSISWQYILVEVSTGILFVLVHLKFFTGVFDAAYIVSMVFYLVVVSLLVVVMVIDFHHKIIPNRFVYTLIVLGGVLLFVSFTPLTFVSPMLSYVLAGPILFAPFAFLWFVSKGTWMGFGDAKLSWAFGWLLGLKDGITAVVLAFWIGALYFLFLLLIQKVFSFIQKEELTIERESGVENTRVFHSRTSNGIKRFALLRKPLKMKSEVPFGPFLVLGMLLVVFTGVDILTLVELLLF